MDLLHRFQKFLGTISSEWCFCAGAVAAVLCPAAAPAGAVFFRSGRAFCFLAGVLGVLFVMWGSRVFSEKHFADILWGDSGRIEYVIELADHRLTAVEGMDCRNGVTAKMRKFRLEGEKDFHKCSGEVIFYSKLPVPPVYGTVVSGHGVLQAPAAGAWSDSWTLQTDIWRACGVERSWRHYVFKVRDLLMSRVCSGIRDDDNRNLAGAFFFGSTGGMTAERRSSFTAAGTVHLFAVSGLHIGMFSFLTLLLLRFVPFRSRYFLTVILTWGYVFLTGAAVSAVRAGIMITLFLLARGMLYKVSPWRLLGAAAGLVLITDPGALKSMGFQYSFLITGVLLLGSRCLKELYELEKRKFDLMPFGAEQNRRRRIFNWLFSLFAAVFSGIIAVAAGSVVSICNSVGITPGAVIANWFTMPVLGMLFALLPLKLLFSCGTEWMDSMMGKIISLFFDYLREVADTAADIAAPFYSSSPGIWCAVLLTGVLLSSLMVKRWKYKIAGAVLFCLLFALFPLAARNRDSQLAVVSSDSGTAASVIVIFELSREAVVVNPVYAHLEKIEKILKENGIFRISEVRFTEPSVRNLSGLPRLASSFKVIRVLMPPAKRGDWRFRDRITETPAGFYYGTEGLYGEKIRILREKNKFTIEYPDSGVMLRWKLEICNGDNGRKVLLSRGNGRTGSALLPWSNQSGVVKYEL